MKLHTFPGSVDADFVVDLFERSLEDVHNPGHCAQCLIGCLTSLLPSYSHAIRNYPALRVLHPTFLDRCAQFLTAPRSEEEIDRLQEEMSLCKCDLSDERMRALHQMDVVQYNIDARSFELLGRLIVSHLHDVLQPVRNEARLHKVENNQERAARRGKTVPWPTSPEDVLPYGVNVSISSLAAWVSRSSFDTLWLGLFASIIDLFRKEVVLAILSSPTLLGVFVSTARLSLLGLSMHSRTEEDLQIWLTEVMRSAALYKMLVNYFDPDESRILFRRASEQIGSENPDNDFLAICRDALALLQSLAAQPALAGSSVAPLINDCNESFFIAGTMFHINLDLPLDTNKYGPTIVSSSLQVRKLMATDPSYTAHEGFMRLWFSERCWAPGCSATFAREGRAFAACSGCNRVTYCTRECQARAWKHPDVPHRAICKQIKYLADATGVSAKPEADGMTPFRTVCTQRNVDRQALVAFSAHMVKLVEAVSFAPRFEEAQRMLRAASTEGRDEEAPST